MHSISLLSRFSSGLCFFLGVLLLFAKQLDLGFCFLKCFLECCCGLLFAAKGLGLIESLLSSSKEPFCLLCILCSVSRNLLGSSSSLVDILLFFGCLFLGLGCLFFGLSCLFPCLVLGCCSISLGLCVCLDLLLVD